MLFNQLKLLLWKIYLVQKRSPLLTLLEFLMPTLFTILLLPIRQIINSNNIKNDTVFDAFFIESFDDNFIQYKNSSFAFYPNNSKLIKSIVDIVSKKFELQFKSFEKEKEMLDYLSLDSTYHLFGISFLNDDVNNFTYELRFPNSPRYQDPINEWKEWKTHQLFPSFETLGPRDNTSKHGGAPGYYVEGFLIVQKAIDFALISLFDSQVNDLEIMLKRFPYGPYVHDNFVIILIAIFPYIIQLSFIFTVIFTAKSIVQEKETGLKEIMKLMGMKSHVYWLSWYLKSLITLLPSISLILICFKIKLPLSNGLQAAIIDKTDGLIMAILLILYVSSLTTFTLMCSTFFKKSSNASTGTAIIYILTFLPHIYLSLNYEKLNSFVKVCSCFVNNLALCLGVHIVSLLEGMGIGANFDNFSHGVYADEKFSLMHVMFVMFLNNFIHLFVMFYFDNVLPGDHGIPKPWNFLFSKNNTIMNNYKDYRPIKENININNNLEDICENNKKGLEIKNVSKLFVQSNGQTTKSLDNFSLNVYRGQITVLLGHNGAGKSTLLSIVTGHFEPDCGKILIHNKDMSVNSKEARSLLGYCPQHNLLFDNLTVYEHLVLFSSLKENFNSNEIDEMLEFINLTDKKHVLAKNLSGGMKRKLSVAISFIGDSKVIVLDEPCSGMDPQSRHLTWNLLKKFKKDKKCTILMTTHFMDEAEYLGDRIAIMSKGSLKCFGSPTYLKSLYESDYNMVLTLDKNTNNNDFKDDILKVVKSVLNDSFTYTKINTELMFKLPANQSEKFPQLLDNLEMMKKKLKIVNVSISANTLEQIFFKIEDKNLIENHDHKNFEKDQKENEFGLWTGSNPKDLITNKYSIMYNQFKALLAKRYIHIIRNKLLSFAQIAIPITFVVINLLYIKYAVIEPEQSPPLKIQLSDYNHNYAPYLFVNNSQQQNTLANVSIIYENFLNSNLNTQAFGLNDTNSVELCQSNRQSIERYLSCLGRSSFRMLNKQHLIAVEFNSVKNRIIGHFNNQPYHVPPLILNLITNSLFKYYTNSTQSTITVINKPMPKEFTHVLNDAKNTNLNSFRIATSLNFGLSFLIASFSIFLIKEKISGSKHLQLLSSGSPLMFWLSAFVWDFINYLIPVVFLIGVLMIFQVNQLIGEERIFYLLIILSLYGMAHIPQAYLFSLKFDVPSNGFSFITAWNIMSSQIGLIIIQILSIPSLGNSHIAEYIEPIFSILFPNFAMGQSIIDMHNNFENLKICQDAYYGCRFEANPCCRYSKYLKREKSCGDFDCLYWNSDYWSWQKPGLSQHAFNMFIQFLVNTFLLILIETSQFKKLTSKKISKKGEFKYLEKDSDVEHEEKRIKKSIENNTTDTLIVSNLSKFYSNFHAVKNISFGVNVNECFGFLGLNGAGKSSTFKMITGEEAINEGQIIINKINIKHDPDKFRCLFGYCPQTDPLIEQMTVLETIEMFAKLRGIKKELVQKTSLSLIELLDLKEHENKMCFTLSGGNKRKLSVAISLVGSPSVILLDEPSSGMDPKTKRILWNCLNKIRSKGKALLLTTHSMDEAEALCSKVTIMVNGELKCYGSLQHLKNKYGDGFTLEVRIKNNNFKDFVEFMKSSFDFCELNETRDSYLNFKINTLSKKNSLSNIFSIMESFKKKFSIQHYCLSQTNLEQIFFKFVSSQINHDAK